MENGRRRRATTTHNEYRLKSKRRRMFGALTQRTFRQTLLLTANIVKELTQSTVDVVWRAYGTSANSSYAGAAQEKRGKQRKIC